MKYSLSSRNFISFVAREISTSHVILSLHEKEMMLNHKMSLNISIGIPDDIVAGGRARICPENAILKPEWRGREATFGPRSDGF